MASKYVSLYSHGLKKANIERAFPKEGPFGFLNRSYSVSLLTAKVPTLLPLSAEKTTCTEKISLFPHPGANEIGTSTERVDEGAIGPTGSGIGSRTLAQRKIRIRVRGIASKHAIHGHITPIIEVPLG